MLYACISVLNSDFFKFQVPPPPPLGVSDER